MFGWPFARRAPLGALAARCESCRHFRGDAAFLEEALPGLASLSSGWASVRGDDGLCRLHDRFVAARATCADHSATGVAGDEST